MLSKHKYLHGFNLIVGFGPLRLRKMLLKTDGDPAKLWHELPTITDNNDILRQWKLIDVNKSFDLVMARGIKTVSCFDQDYPNLLKEIHTPPPLLYYLGNLPAQKQLLTVVGTRKITTYGQQALRHLLAPLLQQGVAVISGLAFGVDGESHKLALQHHAYTAAIIASGVDLITPKEHTRLAEKIIEQGGGIISEFVPGTQPQKGFFPRRNRLLAGISPLTLIIEAASQSGTKITARYALEENRDLACVPGSIFASHSKGCHELLRQGAMLIDSPQDLLDYYSKTSIDPTNQDPLLQLLNSAPLTVDELFNKLAYQNKHELLQKLTELELQGLITRVAGGKYIHTYSKG